MRKQPGQLARGALQGGVEGLVSILDCACRTLELDPAGDSQPRKIARAIIMARMSGETDPRDALPAGRLGGFELNASPFRLVPRC